MRITFLFIGVLILCGVQADRIEDSVHVHNLRLKAASFKKNGDLIGCIEYTKRAIEFAEKANISKQFIDWKLKNYLANRYSSIGDFDRAIELGSSLLINYQKNGDVTSELLIRNNLGVYFMNIGNYAKAYEHFYIGYQKARTSNDKESKLDWLDGLANSCIKLGHMKEAKGYLSEASQLLQTLESKWKDELFVYHNINWAEYYLASHDDRMAVVYYEKCLMSMVDYPIRKGADAANSLAKLYLKQGRNKEALQVGQLAKKLLGVNRDRDQKDPYLILSYYQSAKALLELGNYAEALAYVYSSEEQSAYYSALYMFAQSKFFLDESRRKNLELGVKICHLLNAQNKNDDFTLTALLLADKAKSNVLKERLSVSSKTLRSKVTEEVKSLRFELVYQLNLVEKTDVKKAIILRNRLDSLNGELGLKEASAEFNISAFQQALAPHQVVLEYFFVDSTCYRFCLSNKALRMQNIGSVDWSDFWATYSSASVPESDISTFQKRSYNLYTKLLDSILDSDKYSMITIVPDKYLNILPFEVLLNKLTSKSNWGNLSYLGNEKVLSYGFSLQTLARKNHCLEGASYVGFAPSFEKNTSLSFLKNSNAGVEKGQQILGGNIFIERQATADNFLQHAMQADVLHLFTHGVSSDSSYDASYIYLQDRKMFVDEIMNLPLRVNLCLLTACEVGLGKNYSGEGATGVAWAFKVAGANNVVQSLWKLNEKTSSQLMSAFFENLKDGLSSDVALSKAKQDYLQNPEISTRLKHPYYWAGMSHYGKGTFVETESRTLWYALVIAVLLLFLAAIFLSKTKNV